MANQLKEKSTENNKEKLKTCFVITPIGPDESLIRRKADGVIDAVINPILEKKGYNVIVAHRMNENGSITRQVIQNVINSDLVIANLTDLNPNVMYELAIRHAIKKPLVQICEKGTTLPFDINDQRTIFYSNDMKGSVELKDNIELAIDSAINDEYTDNPIYRAIQSDIIIKSNDITDTDKYLVNRLNEIEESIMNAIRINVNSYPSILKQRALDHYSAYEQSIIMDTIVEFASRGKSLSTQEVREELGRKGIDVPRAVVSEMIKDIIYKNAV